jgi:glycerol-3-phosphate dehydrogenase (NAD(P)+)
MIRAAVLGAGYMGSAITFPLSENKIEVNLCGTWLDDQLIEASLRGKHPRLGKKLNRDVKPMYWQNMEEAVDEADMIFIAIASEGFVDVFGKLLEKIRKNYYFFKLTKGLVEYEGHIIRATEAAYDMFKTKFPDQDFLWSSVGGPVKAVDLAYHTPSGSIYGISDKSIIELIKKIQTDYYRIFTTDDIAGVEVCSTFKNVYSIASGICDGLFREKKEGLYHNLVALLFNQSSLEIANIVAFSGGKKETAFDLAGIGDLHVTSAAGRNRRLGELIGKGIDPEKAFTQMAGIDEYAEGYMALKLAIPWLEKKDPGIIKKLPLLRTLGRILIEKSDPAEEIKKMIAGL